MRSPRRVMAASVLGLEAVTLGLATPVLITVAEVGTTAGLVIGLGLAVVCLVVTGLLRARWAYALGWAIQAGALAVGVVVPVLALVVLAVIFALLWGTADLLGRRLEAQPAGVPAGEQDSRGASGAEPAHDPGR